MKRYVLQIAITEGSDEFWEGIEGSGCDDVVDAVRTALARDGWLEGEGVEVKLISYSDDAP